jgi:hypothetical protein
MSGNVDATDLGGARTSPTGLDEVGSSFGGVNGPISSAFRSARSRDGGRHRNDRALDHRPNLEPRLHDWHHGGIESQSEERLRAIQRCGARDARLLWICRALGFKRTTALRTLSNARTERRFGAAAYRKFYQEETTG